MNIVAREDQYAIKANPYNVRNGYPNGLLEAGRQTDLSIALGGSLFRNCRPLLTIENQVVFHAEFDPARRAHLWATLFDEDNQLIAVIDDNRWIANVELVWDLNAKPGYMKLRQAHRKILLEVDLRRGFLSAKGVFWHHGMQFRVKPSCIQAGSLRIEGSVFENQPGLSISRIAEGRYGVGIG